MIPYGTLYAVYLFHMKSQLQMFTDEWATDSIVLRSSLVDKERPNTQQQQGYRLRPSRLGRAAYITAIEHLIHLHGTDSSDQCTIETYGRRQDIFRTGHDVEARIIEVMRDAGITLEYQIPTMFELGGYIIEGTADCVVDNVVIDIKTASGSNFKRLISGYNDETYRTQLALYAYGLGLNDVALLLYNKDTSELYYKPLQLTTEVARVVTILESLKQLECLPLKDAYNLMLDTFKIPEPPNQMKDKKPTGRYLVPQELMFTPYVRDVLFNTEVIGGTRYVTSIPDDPIAIIAETPKN
jgi:hypothetical protein